MTNIRSSIGRETIDSITGSSSPSRFIQSLPACGCYAVESDRASLCACGLAMDEKQIKLIKSIKSSSFYHPPSVIHTIPRSYRNSNTVACLNDTYKCGTISRPKSDIFFLLKSETLSSPDCRCLLPLPVAGSDQSHRSSIFHVWYCKATSFLY